MNEFKFSTLRQFGSENISFTATVHSNSFALTEKEIQTQLESIDSIIRQNFEKIQQREEREKELLIAGADKRAALVKKLDDSLKAEMKAKEDAGRTMKEAERLSKKNK